MGKDVKNSIPKYVVALYNYNPLSDELPLSNQHKQTPPDGSVQLPIRRGDKLLVLNETLDWWIMCKSLKTELEGYVSSVLLAPFDDETRENGGTLLPRNPKKKKSVQENDINCSKYFPNDPKLHQKKSCPRINANIFSLLTFWWMNSLIVMGFKRPLVDDDIWQLEDENSTKKINRCIEDEWNKEMEKMYKSPLIEKKQKASDKKKNKTEKTAESQEDNLLMEDIQGKSAVEDEIENEHSYKPSLTKAIFRCFGLYFVVGSLLKLVHDVLLLSSPYILGKLINHVQNRDEERKWGYIYSGILMGVLIIQSLILHQYFHRGYVTALRVKSAVMTLVYRKMFKLNSNGRKKFTVGEMVNLMSVDAQKCHDLFVYLNLIWSGPFQIIVSLVGLYLLMGWATLTGFALLLLLIPLNIYMTNRERFFHTKQMKEKDQRSKLMNELLAGIKIIKMYAWEDSFMSKVVGYRNRELSQLRKSMLLRANMAFTISCSPFLVSIVTFAAYIYLAGNVLTAEKAFVSIALFNIIRFPLFIIPVIITNMVQYNVSAKRLTKFLKGEELDEEDVERLQHDAELEKPAVEIKNGQFTWDHDMPILKEIDLQIPQGSLIAVVGQVGTGKSSLLSAILGEIHKVDGNITTRGKIAYVAQQSWIQNQTLKENILFTKKYKGEKYKNIIKACALESDIELLEMGDLTEIGEKGINLSGGQKQRVSLARAVYNNADIYLMDDPLSAVDAHVGKYIFDNVIGPQGILKNKTRILVTHNLSFLPQVDKIVVLKHNNISETGTYTQLLTNGNDFAEFLKAYHQQDDIDHDDLLKDHIDVTKQVADAITKDNVLHIPDVTFRRSSKKSFKNTTDDNGKVLLHHRDSFLSASRYSLFDATDGQMGEELEVQHLLDEHDEQEKKVEENAGTIIHEEKSETGTVNRTVFFHYFKSLGLFTTFIIILSGFFQEGALIGTRVWLAEWSSDAVNNITDSRRDFYIGVYGGIGLVQAIFLLIMTWAVALGSVHASRKLHTDLLDTILHCPMSFFESTPMGRLVNRFVKDINSVDEQIPKSFKSFITTFMGMLGTIFVIAFSTPVFLAVLIPIGALYFFTQRFYVASSRQLKRIASVHRSPVFNHYFESINGASTIRAYNKVQRFTDENDLRIDRTQAAQFPAFSADRWLAVRLEFCGNLITFFAALFCVIQREDLSPGIAGLSISYALQITQSLNWLVRMTSDLETHIISVERINEYIVKPREALPVIEDNRPSENWPEQGAITFEDYSVRYRPGLDFVLKNIGFEIKPGEKVGIVGRTGAGKSSMTLALFRILESASGKIVIDGIDIGTIGLKDLRQRISIIPQDPVLFSGSLRFNVDPLLQHADAEVWSVLEIAHLKKFVSSLKDGLDHEVTEGGENLSVGQRQLICLARALLRKAKILVLDEATAAVDMETDSYIQQTIRSEFSQCTVLTIAHRLNTIIDYDRILVLHQGQVSEFDSPNVLLADQTTKFYGMVKDAGLLGVSANMVESKKNSIQHNA